MNRPSHTAATVDLYYFGVDHLQVAAFFAETRSLVEPFRLINDGLITNLRAVEDAERAAAAIRAGFRLADFEADCEMRLFANAVQQKDGGKRGTLHSALLPDGLTPIVTAVGLSQIKATAGVIDVLAKNDKASGLRGEWLPRLQQSNAKYEKALADRTAMTEAVTRARTSLHIQRDLWFEAIAKHQGFIQMTFPRDRAKQDLFFAPRPTTRRTAAEEAADTADVPENGLPAGG